MPAGAGALAACKRLEVQVMWRFLTTATIFVSLLAGSDASPAVAAKAASPHHYQTFLRQSCRSSLPLLSLQRWPPLYLWRRLGLRLLPLFLRLALRAALGAALLLRTARSRIRFLLSPNILGNHAEADNSPADGHKAPGTTRQKGLVSEAAAESSQAQAPREPRHNYKNRPAHPVRLTHHRA